MLVLLHTPQLRSLGKCVNALCFSEPLLGKGTGRHGSEGPSAPMLNAEASPSTRFSANSSNCSGKSCNRSLRAEFGSCGSLRFIGLLGAGLRAESCVEEDIGVDAELKLETSRGRPGTTVETLLPVMHGMFSSCLMRCGFAHDLCRVIQRTELAENLRGAAPSRINPGP